MSSFLFFFLLSSPLLWSSGAASTCAIPSSRMRTRLLPRHATLTSGLAVQRRKLIPLFSSLLCLPGPPPRLGRSPSLGCHLCLANRCSRMAVPLPTESMGGDEGGGTTLGDKDDVATLAGSATNPSLFSGRSRAAPSSLERLQCWRRSTRAGRSDGMVVVDDRIWQRRDWGR